MILSFRSWSLSITGEGWNVDWLVKRLESVPFRLSSLFTELIHYCRTADCQFPARFLINSSLINTIVFKLLTLVQLELQLLSELKWVIQPFSVEDHGLICKRTNLHPWCVTLLNISFWSQIEIPNVTTTNIYTANVMCSYSHTNICQFIAAVSCNPEDDYMSIPSTEVWRHTWLPQSDSGAVFFCFFFLLIMLWLWENLQLETIPWCYLHRLHPLIAASSHLYSWLRMLIYLQACSVAWWGVCHRMRKVPDKKKHMHSIPLLSFCLLSPDHLQRLS